MEEGIRIKPVTVGVFIFSNLSPSTPVHVFLFIDLEEDGVRIALTIVDTPGFGDNINNEFAFVFSPVVTLLGEPNPINS